MIIHVPAAADRISLNGRLHHMARAHATAAWRHSAALAAHKHRNADLGPSTVTAWWPVRDGRRRDRGNLMPTIKAIIDGLVDAGVWEDDHAGLVSIAPDQFVVVGASWRSRPISIQIEETP